MMRRDQQSIGLFGGSFNPAHAGHKHVAETCLRSLRLDEIWWMVTPQNPLKPEQPSYDRRVATVLALNLPPQMKISHAEINFGTQYTCDTIQRIKKQWPVTRFVFLMGADNFMQLPRWQNWERIINTLPIAVVARAGDNRMAIRARLGKAARIYRHSRVPEHQAHTLKNRRAPAWTFLTTPLNPLSSSAIRANRAKL